MAILFKSWLETRMRFTALSVALAGLCAYFVVIHGTMVRTWQNDKLIHPEWTDPPWLGRAMSDYSFFMWHFLYDYLFQVGWILAVCLLATGGLLSDAANGSLIYSLSLPLRRTSFIFARFWILALEAAALALIPVLVVPALSPLWGEKYGLMEAVAHSLVMLFAGGIFVAGAAVLASLFRSEMVSILCTTLLLLVPQILVRSYAGRNPSSWIAHSGIALAMSGAPHIRSLSDIPWGVLAGLLGGAALLLAFGAWIVSRREWTAA